MTEELHMKTSQDWLALAGRVLIAYLFIPAGIGKLMGFGGTVGYIASKGLPLPELGALIAIVVEVAVALALLLGWRTRAAALVLALFTLTMFVHLRLHTEFSVVDGTNRIDETIAAAAAAASRRWPSPT
jgi:uncharacterized membrane protein YphA (DoxX/SURF4 family)